MERSFIQGNGLSRQWAHPVRNAFAGDWNSRDGIKERVLFPPYKIKGTVGSEVSEICHSWITACERCPPSLPCSQKISHLVRVELLHCSATKITGYLQHSPSITVTGTWESTCSTPRKHPAIEHFLPLKAHVLKFWPPRWSHQEVGHLGMNWRLVTVSRPKQYQCFPQRFPDSSHSFHHKRTQEKDGCSRTGDQDLFMSNLTAPWPGVSPSTWCCNKWSPVVDATQLILTKYHNLFIKKWKEGFPD